MTRQNRLFIIFSLIAAISLYACKDSDEESTLDSDYGTDITAMTRVSKFNLKKNYKILANLDSVFFSIDLVSRNIYNADSLPFGTDVTRMILEVETPNSAKLEVLGISRTTGVDTTFNITANPKDTIDFSRGFVDLRVTAPDGEHQALYRVKVNVHTCVPDSLTWSKLGSGRLPGASVPSRQKTVMFGSNLLCLTQSATQTRLAVTSTPENPESWVISEPTLPAKADVTSLTATADAIYILTSDSLLYTATDTAMAWTPVPDSKGWTYLYGGYGSDVLGVRNGRWQAYPSGISGDLPAEMPVNATSQLITYQNSWELAPQALMAGGRKADGTLTGAVWAFDGQGWFRFDNGTISARRLPASEGIILFPYFTFKTATNYLVTRHSVWMAITYSRAAGQAPTAAVYISQDGGINWLPAPQTLALPSSITPRFSAQAFVVPETIHQSRAVAPITQWEADYVYFFGGYTWQVPYSANVLLSEVRRAIINQMLFKPLQ